MRPIVTPPMPYEAPELCRLDPHEPTAHAPDMFDPPGLIMCSAAPESFDLVALRAGELDSES